MRNRILKDDLLVTALLKSARTRCSLEHLKMFCTLTVLRCSLRAFVSSKSCFCTALMIFFISGSAFAGGLNEAFLQSAAGMKVQSERMKVVAQNIANSATTGQTPGAEPYRRKQIYFKNKLDKKTGLNVVQVEKIKNDRATPLGKKFDPSHPAADEDGYVLLPNVEHALETVDMKEAERGYEANLGAVETTKKMVNNTVDLLR